MISSSSRSTVEQQSSRGKAECTVNTEIEDAGVIPDLNIAHVPSAEDDEAAEGGDERVEDVEQRRAGSVIDSPSWLPEGWTAECRTRTDGTKDKFYIEPFTRKRFRSKVEVLRYLETGFVAKWKRKGKATEFCPVADAPSFLQSEHPAFQPPRFGFAESSSTLEATKTATDFFPTQPTFSTLSSSADDSAKSMELPSTHASFDNLRNIIMKGITPTSAFSLDFEPSKKDKTSSSRKPVFTDYWTSTLGTGSSITDSLSRSSWTDNYKSNNSLLNGMSTSVPSFTSAGSLKASLSLEDTTPQWLDRILNKPPPPGISQPDYSYGLSGSFVQSPLHYLQNAGAFQNNWLNLKPPTAISQTVQQSEYDTPWRSRSWFDKESPQKHDKQERHAINLNHPFVDPEEEKRPPHWQADYRHRHSSHSVGNAEVPASTGKAPPPSASALENLWKKAVPITLEHREFIPYRNGSNAAANQPAPQHQKQQQQHQHHQHQHQQQQQQNLHQNHHQQQKRDHELGVKRSSHKIDRLQEKKRLERLGSKLCQEGLTRLFHELKDRTQLTFRRDRL